MSKRAKLILSSSIILSLGLLATYQPDKKNRSIEIVPIQELGIIDISNTYEQTEPYSNRQVSYNDDEVNKYDCLDLISYKLKKFDKKTNEYIVDIVIKNTSKKTINNINMNLSVLGIHGGFPCANSINILSLNPGETSTNTFKIPLDNLINCSLEIEGIEKLKNLNDKKLSVLKTIDEKSFFGDFNFTYDTDSKENITVYKELSFFGDVINRYVEYTNKLDANEFKLINSANKKSNSYLDLINPEPKKYFSPVKVEELRVDMDKFFNIQITTKLKNESKTNIENFYYLPSLYLFDSKIESISDEEKVLANIYEKKSIKPNEEFTLTFNISIDELELNTNNLEALHNINKFKHIKEQDMNKELIIQLIKDRILSVGYTYSYDIDGSEKTTTTKFSNNGKLYSIYSTEYPKSKKAYL